MISHSNPNTSPNTNPNPPPQEQFLTLKKPNHEVIKTLLKRESSYLSSTSGIPFKEEWSQNQARWRPKISEWFYNIIDHFEYKREIVAIAMDYLDRFQLLLGTTSTSTNTTSNGSGSRPAELDMNVDMNVNMNVTTLSMDAALYQRAAMASLYIAIKMNCGTTLTNSRQSSSPAKYTRRLFYLDEYAELSEGRFTPKDLTEMELLICKTLNWKLNPVIPTCFLDDLLGLFLYDSSIITSTNTSNNTNSNALSSSSSSQDPTISTRPCKRLRSSNNQNHPRTTTTTTIDAVMQLVLTVIYDLACYLIEIALTSSKINFYLKSNSNEKNVPNNGTISPSSFCYAAVLLSMSMTSTNYLTVTSRHDFLQRSSTMLQVNMEEIKYLRKTILNSFIPPHVLRGHIPPEEMMIEIKNLHPLVLLRDAGILCPSFEQNLIHSLINKRYSRSISSPSSSKVLLSGSPKCVVEKQSSEE